MAHPVENVWDYPRPPALQPVTLPVEIVFAGQTIARTGAAWRVLETSHPPVYYLPPDAFIPGSLRPASGGSFCEWKGLARYWTIVAGDRTAERAGWSYPDPSPRFAALRAGSAARASRRSPAASMAAGSRAGCAVRSRAAPAAPAGSPPH
jgi:uncharacterized protein (DUF427 family)